MLISCGHSPDNRLLYNRMRLRESIFECRWGRINNRISREKSPLPLTVLNIILLHLLPEKGHIHSHAMFDDGQPVKIPRQWLLVTGDMNFMKLPIGFVFREIIHGLKFHDHNHHSVILESILNSN